MPFQKRAASVSGPGYRGAKQGLSQEEQQIAAAEAAQPKAPQGLTEANAFIREKATEGLEEARASGMPEGIFHGQSVDPEDIVGTDQARKSFVGRSGYRERFGVDMAIGRVSPQMRKDYGIGDDEFVSWAWQDNFQGSDRNFEDEWLTNNPDGRIPTYVGPDKSKKGQTCRLQGMVLTALPQAVWDEIIADNKQEAEQRHVSLSKGIQELPEGGDEIRRMRDETAEAIRAMLQGSPTMGRELDEVLTHYTPEQTAEIIDQQRYLHTPRPESAMPQASAQDAARAQANAIDRAVETAKAQASGSKSFAVSGFRDRGK